MFIAPNIFNVYQGDTSPIWKSRIKIGDETVVMDATWDCKVQVKQHIDVNETPLVDKTIPYNAADNSFDCFLSPDETASLEVGDYYLFIEISNLTYSPPIRKEYHLMLKIRKQGVHN